MTRKSVTFQQFCRSAVTGRWERVALLRYDKSRCTHLRARSVSFFHSANKRSAGGYHLKAKYISRTPGGGCVEICRNEVMPPSPGKLLFDASPAEQIKSIL